MKIFITGGSGFVGTPTIKALEEKGHEVFNFDLLTGHDIRDVDDLYDVMNGFDVVLHLAAIARFADADADPLLTFETNVEGTRNVVDVAKEKGVKKVVYSSTGSVYMPIHEEPPIKEDFKTIGNSVYGCCKNIGEIYVKDSGIDYVILRYAHLFGQGKWGHGLVGGFLDRIERGLAPTLYGGRQGNDFCYIKDVVDANILAIEVNNKKALNQCYNIGTGQELTAEEAGKTVCEVVGYKGDIEKKLGRTVDPQRFVYDMSKSKELLGFEAKWNFREGLTDYLLRDEK